MHVITWCNLPWTNPVGTQLLPWPSTNQERCRHCFPNISPGAWDPNGPAMALWWDLEPAIFTVPHLYTELKWKHQKHLNELISLPFFARIPGTFAYFVRRGQHHGAAASWSCKSSLLSLDFSIPLMVAQVEPAGEVRGPTTHLLTTPYFNRTHWKARIDGLMSFKTVDLQIGLNAKDYI